MNPATKITLSTARLEATDADGGKGCGTGFFYNFEIEPGLHIPVLVTNKHVIEGAISVRLELRVIKQGDIVKENGHADVEQMQQIQIDDLSNKTIHHPDADVDLCIILIGPILNSFEYGYGIKNFPLNKGWQVDDELATLLRPIETIVMIGYPLGLWDEENNRPIARKGLTASHALRRWNGKRQFVIDAACFHGSSGSPVFLFEDGWFRTKNGQTPGTRVKLLGILCSGPEVTMAGELREREIPTSLNIDTQNEKYPVINLMINLGYVVHADALNDFPPLLLKFHKDVKAV